MICTEEEAKKRLCVDFMIKPFEVINGNCLAALCMAWKWHGSYNESGCCGKVYPDLYSFPKEVE